MSLFFNKKNSFTPPKIANSIRAIPKSKDITILQQWDCIFLIGYRD